MPSNHTAVEIGEIVRDSLELEMSSLCNLSPHDQVTITIPDHISDDTMDMETDTPQSDKDNINDDSTAASQQVLISRANPFYHMSITATKFFHTCRTVESAKYDIVIVDCKPKSLVPKRKVRALIQSTLSLSGFLDEYEKKMLISDVQPFEISQSDHRVKLRGQKGLRAIRDMAPGELIIPIRMWIGTEEEYYQTITHSEIADAAMYDSDIVTPTHEQDLLIGTMYGAYGNFSGLINDFRVLNDNSHCGKTLSYFQASQEKWRDNINVKMIEVTYCGFPYLFFINIKAIEAGTELLADYGDLYWTTLNTLSIQRSHHSNSQQQ